jgi:signal transduction histidine kinase
VKRGLRGRAAGASAIRASSLGSVDLLREWQAATQSMISAVASAAGRSDAARQLLPPMQRQAEVLQHAVEQQQRFQRAVASRLFEPFDAILDLLEKSGAMVREQAEALEQAAHALERAARVAKLQAELLEGATRSARVPLDVARSAVGARRGGDDAADG